MKRIFLLIAVLGEFLLRSDCLAQVENQDSLLDFSFITMENVSMTHDTCVFVEIRAHSYINDGLILILYPDTSGNISQIDSLIQEKFGFQYSGFDPLYLYNPSENYCDRPDLFNLQMFAWLDHQYGTAWRNLLREDSYGLDFIPKQTEELLPASLFKDPDEFNKYR